MEVIKYIAEVSSIIALFISVYQVVRVKRVKREVDDALDEFRERQKRAAFKEWLSKSRELTKELTAIANKVANRKYRGGQGRELKNRIEIFIGDLDEFGSELPDNVRSSVKTLETKIVNVDFENIENNQKGASDVKENFQIIRNGLSEYLRG